MSAIKGQMFVIKKPQEGLTPSLLHLGYEAWHQAIEELRPTLSNEDKEWLADWEMWDLACSPMDDNDRRLIRYGHRLGWFRSRRKQ